MAKERQMIFVRPAKGNGKRANRMLIVRDPISLEPLAETGELKPRTTYWIRRVKCGDCETDSSTAKGTVMLVRKKPEVEQNTTKLPFTHSEDEQ